MTGETTSSVSEFVAGYTLGYETGYEVGHSHGVADEGAAWTSVFTGCAETWRNPRRSELQRAREVDHQPCPAKCRRCSRCIHSLAWYERGARPFLGVEQEQQLFNALNSSAAAS